MPSRLRPERKRLRMDDDTEWRYPGEIDDAYRESIRERFTWTTVLTALKIPYELSGERRNRIKLLCIFHAEKTPSLLFYPDGGFICFGCQQQGDIAQFVFLWFDKTFPALNCTGVPKKALDDFFASCAKKNPQQLDLPI